MKRKTRRLLLRKYAVILILSALSLLYLYLLDWLFGYGRGNIGYILDYLLYSASEKLAAAVMLLALIVPDIIYWVRGTQPGRGSEK
ncbi:MULTISPECIES: hypothetical protein [unclassified Paenibacillus]|uniref:hypothetical protein n=1 Tax=unclassified Paenibacillus TaxID=185978 RepID=UPI002405DB2A|nr:MULTISPECIES: hypothetical protein [unclassified Paenibacillus]MDF9842897.1 phosphotransferase system glucose/maltose/N-acetylglucosamine-specific IIC component [Paenibacillus sp. PastF-2]MDF9849485.1 phosphotransferase system glucose/maltose/N-acetylglucosamine-specific IIC component [Paenibacillus sp. PastM-2]MDF9856140.1 phosphotransferase system glucose/maltose/N-acetylglucosamine-specific IIC component [Paenibacillus sp. PastF-1]MDH6481328.1 phosphotransferase system glucose/maltose/N-a